MHTKINYCSGNYKGAIRDADGIWYFVPKDSTKEILLYDFTANVGDTISNAYCEFGPTYCLNGLATYIVTSVTWQLINGKSHRTVGVSNGGNNGYWIEGIGNDQGLFWEAGLNVFLYSLELHCFSINDSTLYSRLYQFNCSSTAYPTAVPCALNVGIDDYFDNNSIVKIYPNPADRIAYIHTENEKNKKTELFDITGKLIYSLESTHLKIPINVESFEKGIYFIKVTIGNNSITQKLVKI